MANVSDVERILREVLGWKHGLAKLVGAKYMFVSPQGSLVLVGQIHGLSLEDGDVRLLPDHLCFILPENPEFAGWRFTTRVIEWFFDIGMDGGALKCRLYLKDGQPIPGTLHLL